MLFGGIGTNPISAFDLLVLEFISNAGKGATGIVSKCRCNIFTVGNRYVRNRFCVSASNIRESFSPLKTAELYSRLVRCSRYKSCASAQRKQCTQFLFFASYSLASTSFVVSKVLAPKVLR